MLFLHHFNVFGYNSTSIVILYVFTVTYMYLLLLFFFLIYLFVTAKTALPKIVLKKLPGLEAKRQTNK